MTVTYATPERERILQRGYNKKYYEKNRAKVIAKAIAYQKKKAPPKDTKNISLTDNQPETIPYSDYDVAADWQESRNRSVPIVHDPRLTAPPRIGVEQPKQSILMSLLKPKNTQWFGSVRTNERGCLTDTRLPD